ncbi:MAG: hypothetical protein ACI4XM_08915 [Candidatus Coprovivens sp.]
MSYYDKNVIKYIDPSIVLNPLFDEWFLYVEDILLSDEFQKRKLFMHHYNLSVWDHSILVSFNSFLAAKYFNASARVCAIAGLLHDFYTQAWIYNEELAKIDNGKYLSEFYVKKPLFKMHAFVHGDDAASNALKYFPELVNDRILNSIKRHMFPVTIIPPKYKEGFLITSIDKLNSVRELPSPKVMTIKIKNKIYAKLFKKI